MDKLVSALPTVREHGSGKFYQATTLSLKFLRKAVDVRLE